MRRKLRAGPTLLNFLVAVWLTLACNLPFWRHLLDLRGLAGPADAAFLASAALLALLANNVFLTLFAFRPVLWPVLTLVLVVSPAVAYFIASYGIVIDKAMIRNVFETDSGEAGELLSWKLAATILLLGIMPAVALFRRVEVVAVPWRRELLHRAAVLAATALGVAIVAATSYDAQAALHRNHREIRHMLVPANYLAGLMEYVAERARPAPPYVAIGADAHLGPHWSPARGRHVAAVIVVGETARAANFSLGGYERQTNPRLAAEAGVIYFSNVAACATSTATSLPCMFSDLGRAHYDPVAARSRDNLLEVLRHAGLTVAWLDNNSGCKGLCRGVGESRPERQPDATLCGPDGCYDDILLRDLRHLLDSADRDLVVILHQQGSHGPGYHLRYPPAYERFKPVCREIEFQKCSPQEVVNAYDNTILYTDHVVAAAIDLLRQYSDRLDTGLIYVSDHGESLGERGLYLHGLPWAIAPDVQKAVPMLAWLSPPLASRFGINTACLERRRNEPLTHDYLFHSVLGLLDVETRSRDAALDLFAACHANDPQRRLLVS